MDAIEVCIGDAPMAHEIVGQRCVGSWRSSIRSNKEAIMSFKAIILLTRADGASHEQFARLVVEAARTVGKAIAKPAQGSIQLGRKPSRWRPRRCF
jgi:hypothetical protein